MKYQLTILSSPFFNKLTVLLPPHPFMAPDLKSPYFDAKSKSYRLTIVASGAESKPYVKSLKVNGKSVDQPIIRHEDIMKGGEIVFDMSETPQLWGGGLGRTETEVSRSC